MRRSGVVCESRQEGFVDYWGFVISESGGSGMWFMNFRGGLLVENSKKSTCCVYLIICFRKEGKLIKRKSLAKARLSLWALTDSNRRPSACKADALNPLS